MNSKVSFGKLSNDGDANKDEEFFGDNLSINSNEELVHTDRGKSDKSEKGQPQTLHRTGTF